MINKRKEMQYINGFSIEKLKNDLYYIGVQGGSFWEKMSFIDANNFINYSIDKFKNITKK